MKGRAKVKGFSLVEILISTAIGGIVFYMSSDFILMALRRDRAVQSSVKMLEHRDRFVAMINSDTSWSATIQTKPFSCLKNKKKGCSGQSSSKAFTPVNADASYFKVGNIPYKPSQTYNKSQGFSVDGNICDGFQLSAKDSQCPFRFEFYWKPLCPGPGKCLNPSVEVSVKFLVSKTYGKNLLSLDPSFLDQTMIRSPKLAPLVPGVCPPGQVVISIHPVAGTINCRRLDAFP